MPRDPDPHKVPLLPPGFSARRDAAPWTTALAAAEAGAAPGTLVHAMTGGLLEAALILTPDRPVDDGTVLRMAALAMIDTLVAIVAPETMVAAVSDGVVAVNRGEVATARIARGPALPDGGVAWLVLGLTIRVAVRLEAPGLTPWLTDLAEEGIDVDEAGLLESLCRHLLSQIDLWQAEGAAGIARAWDSRIVAQVT